MSTRQAKWNRKKRAERRAAGLCPDCEADAGETTAASRVETSAPRGPGSAAPRAKGTNRMPDWIDAEYSRRRQGATRLLSQYQHEQVNRRYPGATLEYCIDCGDPTGRAGKQDDSLYFESDDGPYCHPCFSCIQETRH